MDVAAGGFPRRLADTLQTPDEHDGSLQLLGSLVEMLDHTDSFMAGHSQRVADLATSLARIADLAPSDIERVRRAALVHDIGKNSIPERVLRKHDALTNDELHLIRLHPIFGASMLSRVPGMEQIVSIVLHHHEHWDGSGYPAGLSMTDIPRESRIIAVADAFDAMTSYRPYGEVLSSEEALTEIRRCAGTQFDPMLVDAMHEAFLYGLLTKKRSSLGEVKLQTV